MTTTPATFSSALMRERDRIVEEKHQKELSNLERKIYNLRRTNDDSSKQSYDMQARTLRLANCLGFRDLAEAQIYIDMADHQIPYKDCLEEVSSLKIQLEAANSEVEGLKEHLALADKERDEFRMMLDASRQKELEARKPSEIEVATLKSELSELKNRFDDLRNTYERATERYKADYKKWRKFNAWLSTEKENGIVVKTRGDNKMQHCATVMRNKRKLQEMNDNVDAVRERTSLTKDIDRPPPLGDTTNPYLEKEENPATPALATNALWRFPVSPVSSAATKVESSAPSHCNSSSPSTSDQGTSKSRPFTNSKKANVPLLSPSIFLIPTESGTTRGSINFKPIPAAFPLPKDQPDPTPSRVGTSKQNTNSEVPDDLVSPSSETEEETQELQPTFKIPDLPTALCSSDTEEDTTQSSPLPQNISLPTPKSLARPSAVKRGSGDTSDVHCAGEPPRKMRRVDATQTQAADSRGFRLSISNLSQKVPGPNADSLGKQRNRVCVATSVKRGKDKENAVQTPTSGPVNSTKMSTPMQNYSVFKGRGRYSKAGDSTAKTINSIYAIDSSRNGGMEHPYDEVVRRKEDRKRMDAGDCECCREYYEAVGPLPPRLQPPPWRSPPKTGVKKRAARCTAHKRHISDTDTGGISSSTLAANKPFHHGNSQDQSQFGLSPVDEWNRQIEDHKKAVSRHRHHWARARTPPGYWDIGFPNTQEAAKINEKAKEMHRKKQVEVEISVRNGEGRYRKR